jgi:hypothetical protein
MGAFLHRQFSYLQLAICAIFGTVLMPLVLSTYFFLNSAPTVHFDAIFVNAAHSDLAVTVFYGQKFSSSADGQQ